MLSITEGNTLMTDMNTLSNVDTRQGGIEPPHVGFTSNVSSEAQSSQTGVSVRYAQVPDRKWFVLRVTYNRISKIQDIIENDKAEVYLPMRFEMKLIKGKKKRVTEPLLPNILFVYTTEEYIKSAVENNSNSKILNYYYNHFDINEYGKNPPLTVRYKEMMNVIHATNIDNEHIRVVEPEHCHYKNGDMVKIIDGDFKGVEGRVARVAGQQRVIVEIEGLCMVATAYIPTAFLKPLNSAKDTSLK